MSEQRQRRHYDGSLCANGVATVYDKEAYVCRCDPVQRDMTRNRGLLAKLFPDSPELNPMPSCSATEPL